MVAAKFFDDEKISNASYAKIGGISRVEDLNVLEIELLQTINYSLKVDRSTFNDILLSIELDEGRQISSRLRSERSCRGHPTLSTTLIKYLPTKPLIKIQI